MYGQKSMDSCLYLIERICLSTSIIKKNKIRREIREGRKKEGEVHKEVKNGQIKLL